MPAVDVTWYDGVNNIPSVPEGYGVSEIDPNIPPVGGGKEIQPAKLNPGKIIYSKELTFKGGSHGSTLSIIPEDRQKPWLPNCRKYLRVRPIILQTSCLPVPEKRKPFAIRNCRSLFVSSFIGCYCSAPEC